jgi:hypothetical protein
LAGNNEPDGWCPKISDPRADDLCVCVIAQDLTHNDDKDPT